MTTNSVTAETRWETYTEAAARLGITAEAVRAHAKRQRWPRQRPNRDPNGPVLIAIPPDFRPARTRPPVDPGQSGGQPGLADALRLALEQAEQRVVMAEGHRLAAEDRVHRAEARADRAEQAATAAQERADALQTRLERVGAELMTERQAESARADAAQARVDRALEDRRAVEGRAEKAETELGAERQRADALRDRLGEVQAAVDDAQARATEAHSAVEELRHAEAARKARGRLRRAWDGWRGR